MTCIVRVEYDLSDYGTLCDLAQVCGNADYSFTAENLLNDIAEADLSEKFGDSFAEKYKNGDQKVRTLFNERKCLNLWNFFSWLDDNADTIREELGLSE